MWQSRIYNSKGLTSNIVLSVAHYSTGFVKGSRAEIYSVSDCRILMFLAFFFPALVAFFRKLLLFITFNKNVVKTKVLAVIAYTVTKE